MTLATAIRDGAMIAAVGILWDSTELLTSGSLRRFFDWRVIRCAYPARPRTVLDRLFTGRAFSFLLALHTLAAIAFPFVFVWSRPLASCLAALVLAVHLGKRLRLSIGVDGSDQMQTILWTGFLVFSLNLGHASNIAAALFIVSQLILAYIVAGVAKLFSKSWRDGSAIALFLSAGMYTTPRMSRVFRRNGISAVLGASVIGWEILGSLTLLGGHTGLIAFLALGSIFHLSIAVFLGLVTFVFAFLAAYPVAYALFS